MFECIAATAALAYTGAAGLAYTGAIATKAGLHYCCDLPAIDQSERTRRCYNWFERMLPVKPQEDVRDYSEGLFITWKETVQEATRNKYDFIYDQLALKRADTVLDAGSGTGIWMDYLTSKGVHSVGLTLSDEQQKVATSKGLDVRVADYRIFNEEFVGKFDAITALGSSEHVCSSRGALRGRTAAERCNETRIDIWKNFYQYVKPGGAVYITVLTMNPDREWSYHDWVQAGILDGTYGGFYSTMDDIQYNVIPHTGFTLDPNDISDKTADYHYSSVIDPDHFGDWTIKWHENRFGKILHTVKDFLTDLDTPFRWAYYFKRTWMWQFEGNSGPIKRRLTEEEVRNAPMRLKWFKLKKPL